MFMTKRKTKYVNQQTNLNKVKSNKQNIVDALQNFKKEKSCNGRITIYQVLEPIRNSLQEMKGRHAKGEISYNDMVAILSKYEIEISANSLGKYCRDELGYKPTKPKSKNEDAKAKMVDAMLDEMEDSQSPYLNDTKNNSQNNAQTDRTLESFTPLQRKIIASIDKENSIERSQDSKFC